jgi:hypothetical protein
MKQDGGGVLMEPIRELAESIYRERVLRARQESPEAKLLDGPRLFDFYCRIVMDGIRNQFPDADERRVQEILAERIALIRRLEKCS